MVKDNKNSKEIENFTKVNIDTLDDAIENVIMADEGFRELALHEFRASEIWHCFTRLFLWKLFPNEREAVDKGTKMTFVIGKAIHEFFQNRLGETGKLTKIEKDLELKDGDIIVTAHPDGVWDKQRLWEIKSANHWAFKHRLNENDASSHHIAQANMVAYMMNLEYFTITYFDKEASKKNPLSFKSFTYRTDELAAKKKLRELGYVYECIYEQTPPEPNPLSWECQYCEMSGICKKMGLKPRKTIPQQVNELLEKGEMKNE